MDNFKVLNNIEDSILVISNNGKILFENIAAKKQFGSLKDVEKIKKYFNINICLLNPDNLKSITPLDLALESKENFSAHLTYQQGKDEYLYFNVSSVARKNYKVLIFKDITAITKYNQLNLNLSSLNQKYKILEKENTTFVKLKEKAQEQALKMAILNRISMIIRESNDINTIIKSTLSEIEALLGASKTYYAKKSGKSFKIEAIMPKKHSKIINKKIEFDENTLSELKTKKPSLSACIREYKGAREILSHNTKRIIIPIHYKTKPLGVIIALTTQKDISQDTIDILESIATQLATSIMQASLFDQIKRKNSKLQKTLSELKETQVQLINSEKMASLGQLVAGVAHEINTPLGSINSNSDMAKRILSADNFDKKKTDLLKNLNSIDHEAIKRISNIVKSLKKFVRLDEADLQEANINQELDLTLQLLTHETKNKVDIIKNYGPIPKINCYVNMLNQVFMNLIVNACQSITEKKVKGTITITTSFDNGNLKVSFKDTGTGISKKAQAKIFSTGFTTKRKGIGTGLGLAISEKIIQKHKGSISFNSKEGEGSEFIIVIPEGK
ncbi:MAG: GAF domain-containing sensor histidine kinase [Candidatus Gastranaerophilales bacterium]|nr:GAF domain-containing sensor histidine kinase [Candidatus Gastranaerophilales bacterium]